MEATNNHEVSVKEGIKKERLHNKNNVIEKPTSMTMLSIPSPSTRCPLLERNGAPNDQRTQTLTFIKFGYNADMDISNTPDSPKALVFPSGPTNTLEGQTISISGLFPECDSGDPSVEEEDIGKDTIIEAIKANGGKHAQNVTKNVDLLVVGNRPGQKKFDTARKNKIRVISINDFHQLATGKTFIDALRLKKDVVVEEWSKRSWPKRGTKRKTGSKEERSQKTKKASTPTNGTMSAKTSNVDPIPATQNERIVVAGPGKLGLDLANASAPNSGGTVVAKVCPTSALVDWISPGDWIIKIDGMDVRQMDLNKVTSIISSKSESKRVLTLLYSPQILPAKFKSSPTDAYERIVVAGPGKLGLAMVNAPTPNSSGTIVVEVSSASVLVNQIYPGDRIIAIDGENVSQMKANEVTSIISSKKESKRVLTLLYSPQILPATFKSLPPTDAFLCPVEGVMSAKTSNVDPIPATQNERIVVAGPGKLGLDLANASAPNSGGTVVAKVCPTSALVDWISPGDWIIKIDGMDVRQMDLNKVTSIISSKSESKRVLTLLYSPQILPATFKSLPPTDVN